jgi:hypothetical protein
MGHAGRWLRALIFNSDETQRVLITLADGPSWGGSPSWQSELLEHPDQFLPPLGQDSDGIDNAQRNKKIVVFVE